MSLEHLEQDRAELQAVLDDLVSGKIKLKDGHEDYVASLKWRLRMLDAKMKRPRQR